jgi:myo-inositol-1(or 4)-monophosphatase
VTAAEHVNRLDLPQLRVFVEVLLAETGERLMQADPSVSIHQKAQGDWFSELDLDMERFIRQRTAAAFPDIGFLGEEGGQAGRRDLCWVVDPIDGSMNFLRALPHYAVSVALVAQGEPLVAGVLDPVRGELFSAAQGLGATCNGRPLAVAGTTGLMQALAATVFPKPGSPHMRTYQPRLARVLDGVGGVRRTGSMALDLAYLAAGRVDLFWSQGMGAWDAAAGVLLIREAGGVVFTLDGQPWMSAEAVAAAVPGLAPAWRDLLSPA